MKLVKDGEYDVYEWVTRAELESIFLSSGFVIVPENAPDLDSRSVLAKVQIAITSVKEASYPTNQVRKEVLTALNHVEVLANTLDNPAAFFEPANFMIHGAYSPTAHK